MERSERVTLWCLKHHVKFRVYCSVLTVLAMFAVPVVGAIEKWDLGFTVGLSLTTLSIIITGLFLLFRAFRTVLFNIKDEETAKEALKLMINIINRRG